VEARDMGTSYANRCCHTEKDNLNCGIVECSGSKSPRSIHLAMSRLLKRVILHPSAANLRAHEEDNYY